jgi:hypothetical protein
VIQVCRVLLVRCDEWTDPRSIKALAAVASKMRRKSLIGLKTRFILVLIDSKDAAMPSGRRITTSSLAVAYHQPYNVCSKGGGNYRI